MSRTKVGQYFINKHQPILVKIEKINGEWIDYTIVKDLFLIPFMKLDGSQGRIHYKKFFKKYRVAPILERVLKYGETDED